MLKAYLVWGGQCRDALFYSAFHAAVTDKFCVPWNIVADEAPGE